MPLMVLSMVLLAGLGKIVPVRASAGSSADVWVIKSEAKPRDFSVSSTLNGRLEPESRIDIFGRGNKIKLNRGTAHVRAFGQVEASVGDVKAFAMDTDFMLMTGPEKNTIVSLTASMLVKSGGKSWILPPGYQLVFETGAGRRAPLPAEWLANEKINFETLENADDATIGTNDIADNPAISGEGLIGKEIRKDGLYDVDRVELIYRLVRSSAFPELEELVTIRLIQEGERITGDAAKLILGRVPGSDIYADLPHALPQVADSTRKPVVSGLVKIWSDRMVEVMASDPGVAFGIMHNVTPNIPAGYLQAGYPKQAQIWEEEINRLLPILKPLFGDEIQAKIDEDFRIVRRDSFEIRQADYSGESPAKYVGEIKFTNDQLVSKARILILGNGFMQSALTSIKILEDQPDSVRITGVFRAEGGRDISYDFAYDAADERISEIKKDGVTQPNSLKLEQFLKR